MVSPAIDEIEVTIMGNGFGECIAVHYGNHDWIVIDSFESAKSKEPVAVEYFNQIGTDISNKLKYIVASHADTDHIRGISSLYSDAKNAIFVMSDALRFTQFVLLAKGSVLDDHGTITEKEEFSEIYSEIKLRSNRPKERVYWGASCSQRIFCDSFGSGGTSVNRELWSLSPSDKAKSNARKEIASIYDKLIGKQTDIHCPRGKIPKLNNNHTSVVLQLIIGNRNLLFGADLEELDDPTDGWQNVISLSGRPSSKSEFFKIPHHGSSNAHNDGVWANMIEAKNTSCLTAYSKSKNPLPRKNQLRKISLLSSESYLVGSSKVGRAEYNDDTNRLLRKIGKQPNSVIGSYGRITFRSSINDPRRSWSVDQDGHVSNIRAIPSS